jgi:hypothetical protein
MGEKQVTIVTLAILGVVLLAGGGGILYIHTKVIKDKQAQITKKRSEKKIADDKRKLLEKDPKLGKSKMEATLERLMNEAATKRSRIPDFAGPEREGEPAIALEYDYFVNLVEKMKRRSGVILTVMRWLPPKRVTGAAAARAPKLPPNIHKASFEITCQGTFYQLVRFLNLAETAERFVNLESFTMTAGKTNQPNVIPLHQLKVSLHTFAYKTPTTAPAAKDKEKPVETAPTKSTDFP